MPNIFFQPQSTSITGYVHGGQDILIRWAIGQRPAGLLVKVYAELGKTLLPGLAPAITPVDGDAVLLHWTEGQKTAISGYSSLWFEMHWDGVCQLAGPLKMSLSAGNSQVTGPVTVRTRTSGDVFFYADQVIAQVLSIQLDVTTKLGQINTAKQHVDQQVIHVDQQVEHIDQQVEHIDDQRTAIDQLAEQTADDRQATHQDRQAVASDKQTVADNLNLTNTYKNSAYNSAVAAGTSEDNAEASAQTATSKAAEAAASAESAADSLGQVEVLAGQTANDRQATNQDRQQVASDKQTVSDNLNLTNQYKNNAYNSAVAAGTSETNAKTSENNAAASALLAQQERIAAQENRYRYMGSWAPNTDYVVGDGVLYGNSFYRRKTAGNSGATFAKANWDLLAAGVNPRGSWAANTGYLLNDLVVFRRSAYLATSDFTSGSTFSRANWLRLFSGWNPTGQWLANTQYYEDDIVRNAGSSYRVTTDHVSGVSFSTTNLESVADKGDPGTLTASAFIDITLPLVTDKMVIQRTDNTLARVNPVSTGYPDMRPSMMLDFANSRIVSPRVVYSRANAGASRINALGYVEKLAANMPRIDHDPTNLKCLGLLYEETRQNVSTYFEDGDQWAKLGATVTANAVTAPSGNLTADKLVENTSTGAHIISTGGNVTSGSVYTATVYLKAAERTFAAVDIFLSGITIAACINLTTGQVVNTTTGATVSTVAYRDGWWKVIMPFTANLTAFAQLRVYTCTGALTTMVTGGSSHSPSGNYNYTGDGTSGLYFWGGKLEPGAFSTSDIFTTTATITRGVEVVSIPITPNWYNGNEGTFYCEFIPYPKQGGIVPRLVGITSASRSPLTLSSPGNVPGTISMYDSVGINTGNTALAGQINRTASAWGGVTGSICLNAGAVATGSQPLGYNFSGSVFLGSDSNFGNAYNGWIRKFMYWPKRLTDAQLQYLTQL